MRRGNSEWLLVPLFLLPLLAGGAFVLFARGAYVDAVRPYRDDGPRLAARWLAARPEAADFLFREFERRHDPGDAGTPVDLDGFPLRIAGPAGPAWTFSRSFPAGLTPAALAESKTRLAIETGAAPASAGAVDAGTAAFRTLLAAPDPALLRAAPLPPTTKRFLLRRGGGDADAERIVDVVARLLAGTDGRPEDLGPGEHDLGGLAVLVSRGAWPAVVLDAPPPADPIAVATAPDGLARLEYGGRGDGTFRMEAPLAGAYAFALPHGDRWWEGPVFARWSGPVAGAMLLFLVIPTALLVSLRRRRRLDDARARFINELAHDLRTPLTSLRLYAEMLAAGRAPEEERARYVETMARESERLSGLLANLLDLARLERGAREFRLEDVDVEAAVEAALRDFAALHPGRADDVRVAGPDDVTARADPSALARCLANLLDNAGKFTPAGAVVRVTWERDAAGRTRIRVADEGPGIPPAERGRLFRRYERGAAAVRDGIPGTGLGLALVAELTEGMGGSVRLLDTERGAAFELILPGGRDG